MFEIQRINLLLDIGDSFTMIIDSVFLCIFETLGERVATLWSFKKYGVIIPSNVHSKVSIDM